MKYFFLLVTVAIFGLMPVAQAALPPAFHNAPFNAVKDSLGIFRSSGLGPRSLSIYMSPNDYLGAGIFDAESFGNIAKIGMAQDTFGQVKANMAQQGYELREFSIFVGRSKVTIFNGIWAKPSVPTFSDYSMTDDQFTQRWQEWVVQKGYRIADHVVYTNEAYGPADSLRHAAIFVKDGKSFFFFHGLDAAAFGQKAQEMANKGFVPDNLNIGQSPFGEIYSGIWLRPTTSGTFFYYNMVASEYQSTFNEMAAKGYRLKKVFGYRNGDRFAAIWVK